MSAPDQRLESGGLTVGVRGGFLPRLARAAVPQVLLLLLVV